jgi:hypothetical protein
VAMESTVLLNVMDAKFSDAVRGTYCLPLQGSRTMQASNGKQYLFAPSRNGRSEIGSETTTYWSTQ